MVSAKSVKKEWRKMKNNKRKYTTPLRIIPLGGLKEVGKNMTAYEYGKDIIVVDTGIKFPDDDLLGVDVVIPDTTYLEKNFKKIRAIIYTHGHEDHIGGAPYILKKFKVPIYSTRLTLALIDKKLKEHKIKNVRMIEKKAGDVFKIGPFTVELIHVNHSIPDAVAVYIKTKAGTVIQTGDFKVDYTPVSGEIIDLRRFGSLGSEGIDLLLSDSTNAQHSGFTMSESTVGDTFESIFRHTNGRIVVASFASNLFRIQQIINSAREFNRKIAFTGRSMNTLSTIGIDLGYLKIPEEDIIDIRDINRYPDNEIVLITTGSQGEPMAGLTRMADGIHRQIELKEGDTVILSSSPIPGNEKSVYGVINKLYEKGIEVIYDSLADVHVSGHACEEELKLMIAMVKPKNFLPVHGEYAMLKRHRELAISMGMNEKNTFIIENGGVIEILGGEAKEADSVPAGRVLIDGLTVGDVGRSVLKERKQLSEEGLIIVLLKFEKNTGNLYKEPDIISRGFIHAKDSEALLENAKELMTESINGLSFNNGLEYNTVKQNVKDNLSKYIYSQTKRKPMVFVFLTEV